MPTISPMGNMPVLKDLVVDMAPFWDKIRAMKPWLDPGYDEVAEKERIVSQQQMNAIHKEALCIMCGCCVSECNSMESDPEFLGPAALAKGFRFVGDVRDQADIARLNEYNQEHGIWDCTRCYFCNERCPKGVDPRDAIAKLGAESIKQKVDHDMGAKHAKWFVKSAETTGWLRETELVPKTQGTVEAVKQIGFALKLAKHGKVPPPFPPHVAKDVKEARALHDLVRRAGPRRRGRDRPGREGPRDDRARARGRPRPRRRRAGSRPSRQEARVAATEPKRVAYYKGCLASLSAKELDISTQALAPKLGLELDELESVTCCGAGDIHEAEPDYYLHLNARILAYAEADGLRHADDDLQRLHAQPAAGELAAQERRRAARAREREPRDRRRAAVRGHRRGQAPALADRRGRRLRAAEDRSRTRA